MTQRKLTDDELRDTRLALWHLRQVVGFALHPVYAGCVISDLDKLARYGTTDGRPYVEPTPEIGEGYRVATEADARRRDREYWNLKGRLWMTADTGVHAGNYTYRVPVDRIPTDEDAKQRPTVMVRDRDDFGWHSAKLIGVVGGSHPFVAEWRSEAASYRQARFPYPGELDQ